MVHGPITPGLVQSNSDKWRRLPAKMTEQENGNSEPNDSSAQCLQTLPAIPSRDAQLAFDACSVSDGASSTRNSSPRQASESLDKPEAPGTPALTIPLQKRESVSWCDMFDEDELEETGNYRLDLPIHSPSSNSQSELTPSSKNARRTKNRPQKKNRQRDFLPKSLDAELAQMQQPATQMQRQALSGPPPGKAGGIVTIADFGFDCSKGGSQEGTGTGAAPLMADMSSPVGSGNSWPGIMSTAPSERPRPTPVCLSPGAMAFQGCASPAGDASMRTPAFATSSPAASGDASRRAPIMRTGTPMAGAMSPKASFGTDASVRTPVHSPQDTPTWPAEVASPCRSRLHMTMHGVVSTSPAYGHGPEACWSPTSNPQGEALPFLGTSDVASGHDLAARLQAAAPDSYED
eukprot:TRINITY_DN11351_c0_g1_i1.p1 TRINITY_DN11351_c0_g1~~TRINITY_DN11351_c0_g1_i1.p1  ORF type:complete len:405 (+),score=67.43 TRINITY_DN11351_c0_g1_i1:88-1302(+)